MLSLVGSLRADEYRLGADDVVSIIVERHPELSADIMLVPTSGKIDLPGAGEIFVAGKTTRQLAEEITKALEKKIVRPDVTVSLKQQRSIRLFVLGAVAKPGIYDMKPGWRVTEALAAAGNTSSRLDETTATLARAGQPVLDIDLKTAVEDPASGQNQRLEANDVLVVIAAEPKRITVSGDVVRPDVYELRRAPRLLDALVAAGGLKQRAQASRGFVLRKGRKIDLNLTDAVDYKDPASNLTMEPGDVITVQAVPALRISVDGFVRNPGNYDLDDGSRVIQAIAQAGGLTVSADQVVASVRRGGAILPVNLESAAFDSKADLPLQSGDVVLLSEPQIIRVQVTGQVNKPGPQRLLPNSTVLDAISRAGGLAITRETARIAILRIPPKGQPISLNIDASSLLGLNDLSQNVRLQEGDLVSITQIKSQFAFISGEVARPGAYEIKEGDGVPELVARAGGPTENAALKRVNLQRNGAGQTIDVRAMLLNGATGPRLPLQESDFVVVPRNNNRVLVMQAAARPGYYAIPEDGVLTVGEAMALAGGPRDRAAVKEIALFRETPEGLKRRVIALDKVNKDSETKQLGINEVLQNGDIVYVPEGKTSLNTWDYVSRGIGTLTGLRFLGIF